MQIIISSRHTQVPPALSEVVHEKVGRLERYDHEVTTARVHFSAEATASVADRERCEVLLDAGGEKFVAKVAATDGYAAVDLVVAKLCQQLARHRTRRIGRFRPA